LDQGRHRARIVRAGDLKDGVSGEQLGDGLEVAAHLSRRALQKIFYGLPAGHGVVPSFSSPSGMLRKMSAAGTVTQKRKEAAIAFQSFDCHMANHSPAITMKTKNHRRKARRAPAMA